MTDILPGKFIQVQRQGENPTSLQQIIFVPIGGSTATMFSAPLAPLPGIPDIDPSFGKIFRKVFTDQKLSPFQVMTYPDAHPHDLMEAFNRFANGAKQLQLLPGYARLLCTKVSTYLWDACLIGTSLAGNGPTFGYGVTRAWLRWSIGPGTWQSAWQYDTKGWSATEIDFPEMLENKSLTAHVIGSGAGKAYGLPTPSDIGTVFHCFKTERRSTFVEFSIDEQPVAKIMGLMPPTPLSLMFDSKVGFPWMGSTGQITSSTPNPSYLDIAAVTVDA